LQRAAVFTNKKKKQMLLSGLLNAPELKRRLLRHNRSPTIIFRSQHTREARVSILSGTKTPACIILPSTMPMEKPSFVRKVIKAPHRGTMASRL
jgi:hypothetical protein